MSRFERYVYWWDTHPRTDYDYKLRYTTYAQQLTKIIANHPTRFSKKERSVLEKEREINTCFYRFINCPDCDFLQKSNFETAEQAKDVALDTMNDDADTYNTRSSEIGSVVEISKFDYHLSNKDKKGGGL